MIMEIKASGLSDKAIQARRRYLREYRRAHPDQVRKWNETYWEKKGRMLSEQNEPKERIVYDEQNVSENG